MPLALRYRPQVFGDVIGQEIVVKVLTGMLKRKRIGVGYLFGGPRGTGKTSVARVFAKALNCKHVKDEEPCCKCKVCADVASSKSADVVEVDSACMHGSAKVMLAEGGSIEIKNLVNQKMSVEVLAYDGEKLVPKRVTNWFKNGLGNFKQVKFGSRRTFACVTTSSHEFVTMRGKIKLKNLSVGDKVLSRDLIPTDRQEQLILGTLLGDGFLVRRKGRGQLQLSQSVKQKEYFYWKLNKLKGFIVAQLRETKSGFGGRFLNVSSLSALSLGSYMDLYRNKKDRQPTFEWLNKIGNLGLAVWFMDDGTNALDCVRLYTQSFTKESIKIVCDWFLEKGILAKQRKTKSGIYIEFGRKDSRIFFEWIKFCVPECMEYKLPDKFRGFYRDWSGKAYWGVGEIEITSIKDYIRGRQKRFMRYDIEVEDLHNFVVDKGRLGGLIVGNSSGSVAAIRSIRESSHYRTIGGGNRIWILDEVHSTSREGFNSLLKIMEEPPPKVLFILCTTELTKVPETIISRCFQLPFRAITVQDILKRLMYVVKEEEIEVSPRILFRIAQRGAGSIRDSLTLIDQLVAMHGNDLAKTEVEEFVGINRGRVVGELLIKAFEGDAWGVIEQFHQIWSLLPDSREFIYNVADCFRDVELVCQKLDEVVDPLNLVTAQRLCAVTADRKPGEVLKSISMLEKAMQYTRLNPQILIEMWLLSLLPRRKMEKIVDPLAVDKFWSDL